MRYIFLLTLLLAYKKTLKCKGDCGTDGTISRNECCTNYHLVDGICEVCPAGFFGTNCSVQCHFPSYGLFCGDTCNCNSSECNHIHGCWHYESTEPGTQKTKINYTFRTTDHITGSSETSYNPSQSVLSTGLNSTTLILIVGGVIILFLIVIIIIQVKGQRTRNQDQDRQHSTRSQQYVATAETVYCDIDENYDRMQSNRPSEEVKKEENIPLVEVPCDHSVIPKDFTLSCRSEDSSNESSAETERNSNSTSSSNGSYLKPIHT